MKKGLIFSIISLSVLIACEKHDYSYSVLADTKIFKQTASFVPRKLDILWVIDNSGSMETSQAALTENFKTFIQRIQALKYDFHMAVTTTDAYRGNYSLRDGLPTQQSGIYIMDQNTPELENVFLLNATEGVHGSGDERAFSSFEKTLSCSETTCPHNVGFRRDGAFLAIIILSDEDDFSSDAMFSIAGQYNSPLLIPVSHYVSFLDNLVGKENYNVNAITIMDEPCRTQLNNSFTGRMVGARYMDLATQTKGVSTSLCGDFGENLTLISDSIISLTSEFILDREPIPESIQVTVDGVLIPQDKENGWSYDPNLRKVSLHGNAIPSQDSQVIVHFDPIKPLN